MARKIGSVNKMTRKDKGVSRTTKVIRPKKVKLPKVKKTKMFAF